MSHTSNTAREISADVKKMANAFFLHLRNSGCRGARKRAIAAAEFTAYSGEVDLIAPSKLREVTVGNRQAFLAELQEREGSGWGVELDLHFDGHKIEVMHRARTLGRIAPKHTSWLAPLLETGLVSCWITQVTGGDTAPDGHLKFHGCNIGLTVGNAVEAFATA